MNQRSNSGAIWLEAGVLGTVAFAAVVLAIQRTIRAFPGAAASGSFSAPRFSRNRHSWEGGAT